MSKASPPVPKLVKGAESFLGIDFSGGSAPWRERCSKPTVWIAEIESASELRLSGLLPVQSLPGKEPPFERLITLLAAGDFVAAAIDAPFAIPSAYIPLNRHAELLARVAASLIAPDRPFPSGASLLTLAQQVAPLKTSKPYRETERIWAKQGVNTRSTLWNGPRGGAPFTAACLTLLARSKRPIWPWTFAPGMLVEAFPAAQLRAWGLPHSGYSKPEQQEVREQILDQLKLRLTFTAAQHDIMLRSPDALDAVIAGFSAIAAADYGQLSDYPADGFIAVLEAG